MRTRLSQPSMPAVVWTLLVLVSVGMGCGKTPALTTVAGKVTFRGTPVARGEVHFVSDGGFGVSAQIGTDGMYAVRRSHLGGGIPHGTYKVIVTPPPVPFNESDTVSVPQPDCPDIPAKYREFSTSGLTIKLGQAARRYDISLDN